MGDKRYSIHPNLSVFVWLLARSYNCSFLFSQGAKPMYRRDSSLRSENTDMVDSGPSSNWKVIFFSRYFLCRETYNSCICARNLFNVVRLCYYIWVFLCSSETVWSFCDQNLSSLEKPLNFSCENMDILFV